MNAHQQSVYRKNKWLLRVRVLSWWFRTLFLKLVLGVQKCFAAYNAGVTRSVYRSSNWVAFDNGTAVPTAVFVHRRHETRAVSLLLILFLTFITLMLILILIGGFGRGMAREERELAGPQDKNTYCSTFACTRCTHASSARSAGRDFLPCRPQKVRRHDGFKQAQSAYWHNGLYKVLRKVGTYFWDRCENHFIIPWTCSCTRYTLGHPTICRSRIITRYSYENHHLYRGTSVL